MANPKIQIEYPYVAAAKAYNLSTPFDGVSNIYELISKYAGVTLVAKRVEGAANCNKNKSEKLQDTVVFTMGANVWGAIMNDLFANFASSANAQRLIAAFAPAVYFDFKNFNLVDEYVDSVEGGNYPLVNFYPSFSKNFFEVAGAGLKEGFYGYAGTKGLAIQRNTATAIKANFHDSWSSVQISFEAEDTQSNSINGFSATVADGIYSASYTSTEGAYTTGIVYLSKAVFQDSSHTSLMMDLDVSKFAGSNVFSVGYVA